ncbi:MAG TPA: amidase [Burkholderiales bacterium]|nr:amidase [Burkholderiales bacterium]
MFKEYDRYDATGLADLIRRRQVSAEEVLEAAIARVERLDPGVNAVVTRCFDRARETIRHTLSDGAFRGVPFLLKDLHALCEGVVTSNGCRFFRDNAADHDTELVARYKRGGLVIFGKTNTPELGLSITTEPVLFGPTRNPWDPQRSAGGSSGGAAAAVAVGLVPAAHASDGGGSIRIPSSCCGVFGLKPTRGRNPHGPDRGEGWSGMSTEHVLSRSVRDSAALLGLTSGPDTGAPYFAPPPQRPFVSEVTTPPGSLRIAVATRTPAGEKSAPECERAALDTARLLEHLGHRLEEVTLDFVPTELGPAFRTVIGGNTRAAIETHAAKVARAPGPHEFERVTWMYYEAGAKASAADYARAVQVIHRTGRLMGQFFERYDLLLTPTLPRPPEKLGVLHMNPEDFDAYGRAVALFTAFTVPFNASGNPAMSVPLHWDAEGLPIGVQIAGRYGDEASLFRVAAQLEQARPWFDRRPAMSVSA